MYGLLCECTQLPTTWHCCRGCGSWYDCSLLPWGHTQCRGACRGADYLWCSTRFVVLCYPLVQARSVFEGTFAVGFRACKIGGAFVMRGTTGTVMMGVLLITLCCCMCISLSLTLCSSKALVGFKIFLIFAWSLEELDELPAFLCGAGNCC